MNLFQLLLDQALHNERLVIREQKEGHFALQVKIGNVFFTLSRVVIDPKTMTVVAKA